MSRRVRILVFSLIVLALIGGTIYLRAESGSTSETSALAVRVAGIEPPPPTTTTTEAPPAEPHGFIAAHAGVPSVPLYDSPTATQPIFSLPNPTHEGVPLAFLVKNEEGNRYLVQLPMRPNESTAWVDKDQVFTNAVPNRIVVQVGARRLTVYNGDSDEVVFATNVAVGKDVTPTPQGHFYVDISVAQNTYTPWILSVAGFSDALQSFGGGIGQIAIHGWSDTSVLGRNVSNGCVRVSFDDLWRLRDLAPVGTPVDIVA